MAHIELHDADGVQEINLTPGSFVIGRGDDCDITLSDRRCSKQHCRLEQKNGIWRIVDLASANGTTVNGAVVSQVILESGDEVGIGDVRMVFHLKRMQPVNQGAAGPKTAAERKESTAKKNRMVMIGALVVVAVTLGVVFTNDDDKKTETTSKKVAGESPEETGKAIETDFGEAEETERQAVLLDSLRQRRSQLESQSGAMMLGELMQQADLLVKDSTGTDIEAETINWRDGLKGNYHNLYRDRCNQLKSVIANLDKSQAGSIARSLTDLDELLLELRANDLRKLERILRKSKLTLLGSARSLWMTSQSKAEGDFAAGEYTRSRLVYEDAARDLAGTNFELQAKSELRLFALRESIAKSQAARKASGEVASTNSGNSNSGTGARFGAHSDSLVKKVTAVERLAAVRKWKDAAQEYTAILALVTDENLKERWQWRRDLLVGLARLKAGVIVGVNNESKRSKTVKIGRLTARPFAADLDIIELKFGGTGEVTWKWKEIPQGRLLDLLRFGVDGPETQLAYARAAIEFGNEKRAMSMLLKVAKKNGDKAGADQVYAHWRGTSVPPGGFVIAAGAFLTPDEFADYESTLVAKKLA
jgi:pSer/pThr/pTyr-binding forkhead associated (FHA) protein